MLLIPAACQAQVDGWKVENMKFTIMLRSYGDTSIEYDPATCQFSNIVPDSLGVIKFMLEFIMQQGEDTKNLSALR